MVQKLTIGLETVKIDKLAKNGQKWTRIDNGLKLTIGFWWATGTHFDILSEFECAVFLPLFLALLIYFGILLLLSLHLIS